MTTERQMEQAARLEEMQRAAGRRRVALAMQGGGAEDCVDCGEPIPPARRAAVPWTCRCADCQAIVELGRKQGVR